MPRQYQITKQFKNGYYYLKLIALLVLIGSCKDSGEANDQNYLLKLTDLPKYESNIDHRKLVNGWDDDSYKRGEEIYLNRCFNCHGNATDEGSLPNARKFWQEDMVSGKDPHSMYQYASKLLDLFWQSDEMPDYQLTCNK